VLFRKQTNGAFRGANPLRFFSFSEKVQPHSIELTALVGLFLCIHRWGLAIIGVSGPLMALRDGFWSNRAARVKRLFGGK